MCICSAKNLEGHRGLHTFIYKGKLHLVNRTNAREDVESREQLKLKDVFFIYPDMLSKWPLYDAKLYKMPCNAFLKTNKGELALPSRHLLMEWTSHKDY